MNYFKQTFTKEDEKYIDTKYESELYIVVATIVKTNSHVIFRTTRKQDINFLPFIYIGDEENDYKINAQTTSYGALDIQEFERFIAVQKQVNEEIKELDKLVYMILLKNNMLNIED